MVLVVEVIVDVVVGSDDRGDIFFEVGFDVNSSEADFA